LFDDTLRRCLHWWNYWTKKKLLNTPAERQRRLEEVPEIILDTEHREKETELQVAASNSSQESRGANT